MEILGVYFQIFLLIFVRMYGMFIAAPFYSSILLPRRARILLAIFVSVLIFPMVITLNIKIPSFWLDYVLMLVSEALIGIIIGFLVTMIITIFQLSAQFFSIQMGFGISEVFDPLSQEQMPTIGQYLALIGLLIFFSIDGHLLLISSIYQSFKIIPAITSGNLAKFKDAIMITFSKMFYIALQISLPIVGTVFLVTVSLAILARFAPQMNILMIGFPIYIVVGLVTLLLITPFLVGVGRDTLREYILLVHKAFS